MISQVFMNIFRTKHHSAVKFHIGYKKKKSGSYDQLSTISFFTKFLISEVLSVE